MSNSFSEIIKKVIKFRSTIEDPEERDDNSFSYFMHLLRYSVWWDEEDKELIEELISSISSLEKEDYIFFSSALERLK